MTAAATTPEPASPTPAVGTALGRLAKRLPLHLTILLIVVLWSIPTIALLVSSFRDPSAISATGWWHAFTAPANFTWDNYDRVLNERGMGRAFINSFIISVPATLLVLLVASMAAYAFAWMSFPFRNAIFLIMVALLVVPVQITLIPVLRLYADHLTVHITIPLIGGNLFGVSSFPGLWLAHTAFGLPFAIYLLRNFFGSLPRELIESAQLDGASDAKIFFRIILPLSMPALASLAIFQFLWVWNDLLIALVFLGDPTLSPMTLTITNLVSSFGSSYQVLTAAAFVSMVVPLIIFFALQRYFVQGILAGAVKG